MKYRLIRSTFIKEATHLSYVIRWRGFRVFIPKSQCVFKKKVGYRLIVVPSWLYDENKVKLDQMENTEVSRSFYAKGVGG